MLYFLSRLFAYFFRSLACVHSFSGDLSVIKQKEHKRVNLKLWQIKKCKSQNKVV